MKGVKIIISKTSSDKMNSQNNTTSKIRKESVSSENNIMQPVN
jgi:hypothetical protein